MSARAFHSTFKRKIGFVIAIIVKVVNMLRTMAFSAVQHGGDWKESTIFLPVEEFVTAEYNEGDPGWIVFK